MASDLTLDFEDHLDHQDQAMNNVDGGNICIDQDGEWGKTSFFLLIKRIKFVYIRSSTIE